MASWLVFVLLPLLVSASCDAPSAASNNAQQQQWPVPLLAAADGTTRLAPAAQGFALLRATPGPVAVVAFVGRARSGKSFTLNRVLGLPIGAGSGADRGGFGVGHSVATKTRGAELWGTPFAGANGTTVFVLDTEGLGAAPSSYDKALLLFASLVSSRIVYHLSEYVYFEDVTRLYTIVNLVRLYQRQNLRAVDLPPLTWLVQRFTLQLQEEHNSIAGENEDEWLRGSRLLQRFLAEHPNPGNSVAIAEFNETARAVSTEFGAFSGEQLHDFRALFVPPAVQDTALFADLPWKDTSELDPRYNAAICALRRLLFEETRAKRIDHNGAPLTGPELADFAESVLPAVNEGAGAFLGDRVLEGAARQLGASCLADYEAEMAPSSLKLPLDEDQLHNIHLASKAAALARFDAEMIGENSSPVRAAHRSELQRSVVRFFEGVLSANALKSAERCDAIIVATVTSLRARDYAGNVRLFDFEAAAAIANATSALYTPGPKGGSECAARMKREVRLLRETVAAATLPARVIGLAKTGAAMLGLALLTVYAARILSLPAIIHRIAEVTAIASLALCLLSLWSLDEKAAPVSASTLVAVADAVQWALSFAHANWRALVPTLAVSLLPLLLVRPSSPASIAMRLRVTSAGAALAHGDPAVVFVDNSPDVAHLNRTSVALFELSGGHGPLVSIGLHRRLGLRFLPLSSCSGVCVVGRKSSVDTCERWLATTATILAGRPPPARDVAATWDDIHVAVYCRGSVLQLLPGVLSNAASTESAVAFADRILERCTR